MRGHGRCGKRGGRCGEAVHAPLQLGHRSPDHRGHRRCCVLGRHADGTRGDRELHAECQPADPADPHRGPSLHPCGSALPFQGAAGAPRMLLPGELPPRAHGLLQLPHHAVGPLERGPLEPWAGGPGRRRCCCKRGGGKGVRLGDCGCPLCLLPPDSRGGQRLASPLSPGAWPRVLRARRVRGRVRPWAEGSSHGGGGGVLSTATTKGTDVTARRRFFAAAQVPKGRRPQGCSWLFAASEDHGS
mmetsp:Transcript_18975/g.55046  ORF Transcript_18975/g.55046 Transcript_18975/m.55046 type:complete len:244 (+) Transcript_18975:192-923(+)